MQTADLTMTPVNPYTITGLYEPVTAEENSHSPWLNSTYGIMQGFLFKHGL